MENIYRGEITYFDPVSNKATLKLDWMTPDKQLMIEDSLKEKVLIKIKRPERKLKEYHQLKYYYKCLKKILMKVGVSPTGKNMSSFDFEIKKSLWGADIVKIGDKEIPFVKSKKNSSKEEMDELIERVKETYSELNIDFDSEI